MKRLIVGVAVLLGAVLLAGVLALTVRARRPVLVCLGDSLTSCGGMGGHYSDWLAQMLPDVKVIDAGIGGDTLTGGRQRFERDVLQKRPTVLVIMLGANDFWRNSRSVAEMRADLQEMLQEARVKKIQVIVASCFGERDFLEEVCTEFDFWRHAVARRIAEMERALCQEYQCWYIPNTQLDVKPNRLPPFWDETDHPNKLGNREVALRLLPALHQALARSQTK